MKHAGGFYPLKGGICQSDLRLHLVMVTKKPVTTAELFDLERVPPRLAGLLAVSRPWEVLKLLDEFGVWLSANGADENVGKVHPTAIVNGPLMMEEGAEVGPY